MFGNKTNEINNKPTSRVSGSSSRTDGSWNNVAKGTVVVGNINAEGDLRIEGKVIGTLVCNSKLVISGTGYIEGSVDARNATVEGEIKGNVVTRDLLQIAKSGKVSGDIFTQKLIVEMGAIFTGSCKMGDAAKEQLTKTPPRANELLAKSERKHGNNNPGHQQGNQGQKVSKAG